MRALLSAALLCVLLSDAAAAQGPGPLRPERIDDEVLVRILNAGAELDIDGLSEEEIPPLLPRLYAVPEEGDCVPETHLICGFRYYLAVSEDGDGPEQAVFSLGLLGEITFARFLPGEGSDPPRLRLTVESYPSFALERNAALPREQAVYVAVLGVKELRVARER
jgi:hypothetical protein